MSAEPVYVNCPECGSAQIPGDCQNPCCLANPRLSVERKAAIVAAHEAYVAQQAADVERRRLYALSFRRR